MDPQAAAPLRFVQIGDLHLTDAGQRNHIDLGRIVDELNRNVGHAIDFVYLPGDNADDGTAAQFRLAREQLDRLLPPTHIIPGDHDFKPRSLRDFHAVLDVPDLPYAIDAGGCRCLFLDVVSAGTGGPDFRLGVTQSAWLERELAHARNVGRPAVVFMHTYPDDLGEEAHLIARMIDASSAVLVSMGHTHYNEIAHDGRTIYAATRSTGQIEEGPVGFSFAAVDQGSVSWRFKPLNSPWPFVMVTRPADRRLALADPHPVATAIRASAWGGVPIDRAEFRIDHGRWQPMTGGDRGLFTAALDTSRQSFQIQVRVIDRDGAEGSDAIEVGPPARICEPSGSDAGAIGPWPERHILGTQLGPNRNGRKW